MFISDPCHRKALFTGSDDYGDAQLGARLSGAEHHGLGVDITHRIE